jgi:NHLM bacteriocin system ABC transporter ATP-binding protein
MRDKLNLDKLDAKALPAHARALAAPSLLAEGSLSLLLHLPQAQGRGLLPLGQVDAPAVVPAIASVLAGTLLHQPLAFPSVTERSVALPQDGGESTPLPEIPLDAWFNSAAAMAQAWPLPAAGHPVDLAIARGAFRAAAGQRIASPALVLLRVLSGSLRVEGLEQAMLVPGDVLAAPRELAFTVAEDVELEVFRFGEAEHAVRLACLERLWRLSFSMVWERACQAEAQEELRLDDSRGREVRELESGIGALAGLVEGDASWIAPKKAPPGPLLRVAAHLGRQVGVAFKHDVRRARGNADTAADLAEANGLRARQVLLGPNWWAKDNGALLAFDAATEAPVALLPQRRKRGYVAVDADGKHVQINGASAAAIKPYAFVFYRPLPAKPLTEIDLLRFGLQGYGSEMAAVVALAGVVGALGLVVPLASARVMDHIIPSAQPRLLVQMGLALLVVSITMALFSLVRSLMVLRIQDKMDMTIQAAVWDRVLRMPASFTRRYSVANLEGRVRACQKIIRILSARTVASIFAGAFSALNFLVLFWFNATLALLALGLVALAAGAVTWFRRRSVKIAINAPDSPLKLSTLVLQLIQGVGKLRAAGAEGRAFALWAREHALGEVPTVGQATLRVGERVLFRALDHTAVLVLFAAAGYMISGSASGGGREHLSAGEFVGFFAAFGGVFHGVLSLCETLIDVVAVSGAYFKAKPILDTMPLAEQGKVRPGPLSGKLEVNKVGFAYFGGPPVLQEVSLSARPGDFVAIVGPSGCGKSTLLRLMLGFEQPKNGAISFDDQDLAELHLRQLRRQFGVVLQDTRLLSGDILSNIVGDSGASLDAAWAAAEAAAVADELRALPMGMYTVIGDGPSTLSAGQRQRILLARALVRQPAVLFLDEATSMLDGKAQARVMASLKRLRVTRVVVAHHLATLKDADQIIVLDAGRVAERGTYQELMALKGRFHAMANDQDLQRHGE